MHEHHVVVGVRLVARERQRDLVVDHLLLHADADLREVLLEDVRQRGRRSPRFMRADQERVLHLHAVGDADAVAALGVAQIVEQLVGLGHVALGDRHRRRHELRHVLVEQQRAAGHGEAAVHRVDHGRAVDGEVERLPHLERCGARGASCCSWSRSRRAVWGCRRRSPAIWRFASLLMRGRRRRRQQVDAVDLAGLERLHGGVGVGEQLVAVAGDQRLRPVEGVDALEDRRALDVELLDGRTGRQRPRSPSAGSMRHRLELGAVARGVLGPEVLGQDRQLEQVGDQCRRGLRRA